MAQEPYCTAKTPSSKITSGGLAPLSRVFQAALPSAVLVSPLLHHSFCPTPCNPVVSAPAKEFIAADQVAFVEYHAEFLLYLPEPADVRQLSANTPSATQGWLTMSALTASSQYD